MISKIQQLQRRGALTAEEVAKNHTRHVLTSAPGSQESVLVETLLLEVLPGDRYPLCSDGVSQYADTRAIEEFMSHEREGIPDDLISFANAAGVVTTSLQSW